MLQYSNFNTPLKFRTGLNSVTSLVLKNNYNSVHLVPTKSSDHQHRSYFVDVTRSGPLVDHHHHHQTEESDKMFVGCKGSAKSSHNRTSTDQEEESTGQGKTTTKWGKKKVKGCVVLMKKNVLDFNDFNASILDRVHELFGQGVALQLVSSVNGDPGKTLSLYLSSFSFLFFLFCFIYLFIYFLMISSLFMIDFYTF